MITCSKTLQIPVKKASWMHMTLSILTFQKEKNSSFLKPVHQICTGTKNKSFELQSAPNLHRDKQSKKKHKNFRGIVAPPHLDCEVFVCFVFFFLSLCRFGAHWSSKLLFFWSLCRFGARWSSKLVFLVPVQVLCTLQLKPSVCFVLVEVWYDSCFAIKTYYFAWYWNCLLKHDVVPLFLLVSWLSLFK